MKEVVVISGKGGTGKTSITAAFAMLGGKDIVVGDCDVDAADMHLLLDPDFKKSSTFRSGYIAIIDDKKCTSCGRCKEICRFNAVDMTQGLYKINPLNCEGCGYCYEICPENAILLVEAEVGSVYSSTIKSGAVMVHARLKAGADNSGKLVARVKSDAKSSAERNGKDLILIDGSPGTGCPVISSLTGADYVVLVTEPSKSGIHDLKRVYELVKKFKISAGIIINKYDINQQGTEIIKDFCGHENLQLIAEIPYSEDFTMAMTNGRTITEFSNNNLKNLVTEAWNSVKAEITNKEKL
jgi:MinD superfamily P-loop ATPase